MSSVLELIARRRRASAERRLGPPSQPIDGANGHRQASASNGNGNGHALPELVMTLVSWPELNGTVDAATADQDLTAEIAAVEVPEAAEEERDQEAELEPLAVEVEAEPVEAEPAAEADPELEPVEADPELEPVEADPELEIAEADPELEPVQAEPAAEAEPANEPGRPAEVAPAFDRPGFMARSRMRHRARYLRRLREIQLRDLGGFTVELERFGRSRPELIQDKLASALQTDRELRALETALNGQLSLRELREPGIGGACASCGAVYGSSDRFCAACGTDLHDGARTE